jgi:hypothetical protein
VSNVSAKNERLPYHIANNFVFWQKIIFLFMAFVLTSLQFEKGLQRQSALLLSSLRWLAAITPFSIDAVKTALEQDQTEAFQESEFKNFLSEIFNISLDYTQLTEAEVAILNEIRVYIDPPVGIVCCGTEVPTLELVEKGFVPRTNSVTNQYEASLSCDPSVSCDVKSIELTITPVGEAPAPIGSPISLLTLGCVGGRQVFVKNWLDFVGDPSGQSYILQYNFLNEQGESIVVLGDNVTL